MVRFYGIGIVAFSLTVSCGEDDTYHGDETFTAEERTAIEAGDVWITACTGVDAFPIEWDLAHPEPGTIFPRSLRVIVKGTTNSERLGATYHHRLEIDDGLRADLLVVVAAHEFGHARGLVDLPADTAGVMNPWPGAAASEGPVALEWTAADQDACVEKGVCSSP